MEKRTNTICEERELQYIYVSEYLNAHVREQLASHGVRLRTLKGTKDYWVRDFMPLNLEDGSLLTFDYHPDYLFNDEAHRAEQTDMLSQFKESKEKRLPLILDGGNIVRCGDKVVMTDKELKENRMQRMIPVERTKALLEKVFGKGDVIFLPWDYVNEDYGHADGVIHWLGDGRVLLEYSYWNTEYTVTCARILADAGFEVKLLKAKYRSYQDWCFINMLEYGNKVFVPQPLNTDGSKMAECGHALEDIQKLYDGHREIVPIEMPYSIVRQGGALHCCTWNSNAELQTEE